MPTWTAPIRYEEVEALVSSKQQTAREAVRDWQHAWFAHHWVGRRQGIQYRLLDDLLFRREERLGRLARSRDPLAIIAMGIRFVPGRSSFGRAADISVISSDPEF